ncbi:MAG: response regulator transcription factor [Acidobacteriota bacterium]
MSDKRVLVVEDDPLIGAMIEVNLGQEGFDVTWVDRGDDGWERLQGERFDLVILDLMLPGLDGLQIASRLRRADVGTPVLMLTARGELDTKVDALERGADDYLTKPFAVAELLARAKALVRRAQAPSELPTESTVELAGGVLDRDAHRFRTGDGAEHELNEKEVEFLTLLARRARQTLTRQEIVEEVWGLDALPPLRSVDNLVVRLRRLLEADPEQPRHLLTVRGEGYRYEP